MSNQQDNIAKAQEFSNACANNDIELLKKLIDNRTDGFPNLANIPGLLMNATANNNSEMVDLLLQHQADPNITYEMCLTFPLAQAAQHRNCHMVKSLLDAKADPNIGYLTPLFAAISSYSSEEDIDVVKLLLERGSDLMYPDALSPIGTACGAPFFDIKLIDRLIEAGCPINGPVKPYYFATKADNSTIMSILLDKQREYASEDKVCPRLEHMISELEARGACTEIDPSIVVETSEMSINSIYKLNEMYRIKKNA